ncbi:MAG: caspase family protein, partial [Planctomycetes bacterium]|nr:caspase family protein [Planctomycetota bacterium]
MTLRTLVLLALGICLWATAPSSATPIAEGSGKKGTQYAILVAIAKYGKTDQWRPLPYTIEEMREFRDVLLETGFAKENVEFLHDQQTDDKLRPTAANFVEKIKIILEEIGPDDTLLIALNGHGVQYKDDPVGYFCPVNADLLDKKTMVPMDGKEGVYRLLEACKAKRKLLIVNACRNDPTRDLSFASEKVQLIDRDETEVPKGIAALFSCKPGQKSYYYPEEKQIKRSMFYHHLIEAWRGKYAAGEKVTLDHIFDAVTRKTAADARTIFSQSQTPWPRRKYEGEWLLTKYVPVRPVPKDDSPFPAAAEMRFKAFDRPGVPMFEEITTVIKQTVKTTDQQLNQDQKYVSLIEWTPKEKDSDGNWVVLQRHVGVKLEIDIGGNKIVYDSTQQNLAKNPMTEFFDALLKGELTFVIQRDLTVKSVEGRDELIRKLGVVEPETASLLNSILSEDACKA